MKDISALAASFSFGENACKTALVGRNAINRRITFSYIED